MDDWGTRLAEAMENKGIHKALTLAIELGVSEGTISRWKKSGPITITHAVSLCKTLDVSINWLLLGERVQSDSETKEGPNLHSKFALSEEGLPPSIVSAISSLINEILKHQSDLA